MSLAEEVYDYETERKSICVTRSHGHATFTAEYNANQVNTVILTPPAGRRISVCGVHSATDTNLGVVSLDFAASAIITWRMYVTRFQSVGATGMHVEGAIDEPLTLNTTTGANAVFLLVNYRFTD